jgi:hypothetical protein
MIIVLCMIIVLEIKESPCFAEDDKFNFLLNPIYFGHRPLAFFNGVAAGGTCGVGIAIKLCSGHFFKIHIVVGLGTNIGAELLGMWGLLKFSSRIQIKDFMVVGDSKVIFDWFDGKFWLKVLTLQSWMKKIIDFKNSFN